MNNIFKGRIITRKNNEVYVKEALLIRLGEHIFVDFDEAKEHPYNIIFTTHLNNRNMIVDKNSIIPVNKKGLKLKNKSC